MTLRKSKLWYLTAAFIIGSFGLMAHSNKASAARQTTNNAPIQLNVVRAPWQFSWHNTTIYKYQLTSNADFPADVIVAFNPYVEFPDGSRPNVGNVWYYRHYYLPPGATQTISFRVFSPTMPSVGAYENFCVYATTEIKGLGAQGHVSCAVPGQK